MKVKRVLSQSLVDGLQQSAGMYDGSAVSISRRRFAQGVALAGLMPTFAARAADSKNLNFVTWGGFYGRAVKQYLVDPFEKQSGINVDVGLSSSLAPIKVQVQSKNVQWDLAEIAGGDFVAGLKDDLFEPIDTNIVDLSNVPDYAKHEYGVEYALFLEGLGYDRDKISKEDTPTGWADVWDTDRYKGVRALGKHLSDVGTLEFALLAAGVSKEDLYPLDVKKAFDSLAKLGSDNIMWYENNQEPVNFLEQHQGPFATIVNGRVFDANRNGANLGFLYNQMMLNGDYLVVPKGSKNKELAFELINFILTNDEADVNWMKHTSYTIANTRAVSKMPPDLADKLPTSPGMKEKYFLQDYQWWGENYDKVYLEFNRFLVS